MKKMHPKEIKFLKTLMKAITGNKVNDFVVAIETKQGYFASMVSENGKRLAYKIIKKG